MPVMIDDGIASCPECWPASGKSREQVQAELRSPFRNYKVPPEPRTKCHWTDGQTIIAIILIIFNSFIIIISIIIVFIVIIINVLRRGECIGIYEMIIIVGNVIIVGERSLSSWWSSSLTLLL